MMQEKALPQHRLRLTSSHPVYKKVNKIFALAEKLGIVFCVNSQTIHISEMNASTHFELEDIEATSRFDASVDTIPPTTEWMITCDNPEYLEYQAKKEEALRKKHEKAQKEHLAKKAKKEAERKAVQAERIKQAELKELDRLVKKYKTL